MKKLITILLITTVMACSKDFRKQINCEYQGGIIIEKDDFSKIDGSVYYYVKYKGNIEIVEVYDIDKNYNVGDTIKKPCLQ